jgi:hypothetical protein
MQEGASWQGARTVCGRSIQGHETLQAGIARKALGKVDSKNPETLIVETHTIDYKRQITSYIPAQ